MSTRTASAFRDLLPTLTVPVPNIAGAALIYFYFNHVDPGPRGPRGSLGDLTVFTLVTGAIVAGTMLIGARRYLPLQDWLDRLRAGADPAEVPPAIRRRALNEPLANAVFSMAGWTIAGLFYFPYQLWGAGLQWDEAFRVFSGIVFVGGPVASSLAFLLSEVYWRRRIPLFFPQGRLDRERVFRVPILVRLGATFLVTAVLPPVLMLLVTFNLPRRFTGELPPELRPAWVALVRTQVYIVGATGVVSLIMALLVARFINRPVQALRTAMAQVAIGDLAVRVPVRSVDELGELNERFNDTVDELRQAERARELFGRYVSPAVARQALERGIGVGGELTRATAMFVDLRGFTALTERLRPDLVVEILNAYYAMVEQVCEQEGGVITQFLGDGVVLVFGGPLRPVADHAPRAVRAAIALERALAEHNTRGGERLFAGVGICTGDMIAGNVGRGARVTYTIVGDAVNQAARLQVKTRDLGASILVTESTRRALGDTDGLVLKPCGAVPLRGIAAPVEVYAVEV